MRLWIAAFLMGFGGSLITPSASAVSVCYNNVCGKIVCQRGCVQRVVNGRCVASYCVGWQGEANGEQDEEQIDSFDQEFGEWLEEDTQRGCVSCAGGRCYWGRTFLEAERRCKRYHSFGCFTRC